MVPRDFFRQYFLSKSVITTCLTIGIHFLFWILLIQHSAWQEERRISRTLTIKLLSEPISPKHEQNEVQIKFVPQSLNTANAHSSSHLIADVTKPDIVLQHIVPAETIPLVQGDKVTDTEGDVTEKSRAELRQIYKELRRDFLSGMKEKKEANSETKLGQEIQRAAIKDCRKDHSDNDNPSLLLTLTAVVIYDTVTKKCKWN